MGWQSATPSDAVEQWNKAAAGRKAQEDAPLRFGIDQDATCLRSDLDNGEVQLVMNVTYGKSGNRLYGPGLERGMGWRGRLV
jgi:hypothetical protein